jgi:2-C-methyl-D-erythritol 2,4-cyclodiphosphate synthase
MRIGHGYDVHRLDPERDLILGGVKIEHPKGLLGHSDADVLLHAICDAILGALGLGDIGHHFPDTDATFAGIDSRELLKGVAKKMHAMNYSIGNVDATIVAQTPRLAGYLSAMQDNIASDLRCEPARINIKATTTERLGFCGREEGMEAHAVVLVTDS